jgi:hypothetical protein
MSRNSSSTVMADVEAEVIRDASQEGLPKAGKLPMSAALLWPQPRDEVIFFRLSDKMPDYALKGHFKTYGAVESVVLHRSDDLCVPMRAFLPANRLQTNHTKTSSVPNDQDADDRTMSMQIRSTDTMIEKMHLTACHSAR